MSIEVLLGIAGGSVLMVIIAIIFALKWPKRLKVPRFVARWKELQGYCRDQATWPQAITEADKLLDSALKKRKMKGKTMGERLVDAQRLFSYNDEVWFAHNLAKKLHDHADMKLKEADVKDALVGFRQALRDIGALPNDKEATNDK